MPEYTIICQRCGKEHTYERNSPLHQGRTGRKYCDECRYVNKKPPVMSRKWRQEEKYIDSGGYVLVRLKEKRDDALGWYMHEHRLVMEQKLGRRLRKGELVHHKDNDRQNNHPDNLELFVRKGHPDGIRANDLVCPHCGKPYL